MNACWFYRLFFFVTKATLVLKQNTIKLQKREKEENTKKKQNTLLDPPNIFEISARIEVVEKREIKSLSEDITQKVENPNYKIIEENSMCSVRWFSLFISLMMHALR